MPLTLMADGGKRLIVTRQFEATPQEIYHAHVDPAWLKDWCKGPEGWRMTQCLSDPRPGGAILYRWLNDDGQGFHLTGEYIEVEPGQRTLHRERMFLPARGPDNLIETTFQPTTKAGARKATVMRMVMDLPDTKTRSEMLASGMAGGMEDSYRRLDAMLRP